jgi:hypothetical protein
LEEEISMQTAISPSQKQDVDFVLSKERGDDLEAKNQALYLAARMVLSNWESGDLAAAVRELQDAVDELDDHHDDVAAIEAGWERRNGAWTRFAAPGESLDPEIGGRDIWILDGVIHALKAEHALTQDDFRNLPRN